MAVSGHKPISAVQNFDWLSDAFTCKRHISLLDHIKISIKSLNHKGREIIEIIIYTASKIQNDIVVF